jgi:protein SCO1
VETTARGWRIALFVTAMLGAIVLAVALLQGARGVSASGAASGPGALALGSAVIPPRPIPPFALIGEDGRSTSLAVFRGRWLVLAPAMTLCHEVCPMTTAVLERLTHELREVGLASSVAVAEVTVDPWRDTSGRLRAYRRMTGASFALLTGTRSQIARLWRFLGVYFQRVPQTNPPDVDWLTHRPERFDVQHTDGVFIVDPAGRERVVDEGMPQVSAALPAPLRRLLNAEGRQNLAHPQLPWTASQVLDDLDHLGLALAGQPPAAASSRAGARAAGQSDRASAPSASAAPSLTDSPPPLATLHARAGALLGGAHALSARLRDLRGYPVVLNAWASWCPPCRAELPLLAGAARAYGSQVAFLGADTDDSPGLARSLLAGVHVPYPSYQTTLGALERLAAVPGTPTTIFIDPDGRVVHVHDGQYPSADALERDVVRYALGS